MAPQFGGMAMAPCKLYDRDYMIHVPRTNGHDRKIPPLVISASSKAAAGTDCGTQSWPFEAGQEETFNGDQLEIHHEIFDMNLTNQYIFVD